MSQNLPEASSGLETVANAQGGEVVEPTDPSEQEENSGDSDHGSGGLIDHWKTIHGGIVEETDRRDKNNFENIR